MKAEKKNLIIKLIDKIPESKIAEIIDFIMSLKENRHDQEFKELMHASNSSISFWYNDIDDEVWNNV